MESRPWWNLIWLWNLQSCEGRRTKSNQRNWKIKSQYLCQFCKLKTISFLHKEMEFQEIIGIYIVALFIQLKCGNNKFQMFCHWTTPNYSSLGPCLLNLTATAHSLTIKTWCHYVVAWNYMVLRKICFQSVTDLSY